jgi:hypothetical protein
LTIPLPLALLFALQAAPDAPATETKPANIYAAVEGDWVVDLSVKEDEPYTQPMKITVGSDKVVSGEFYNSNIDTGRAGGNQGRICISFQTSDGMGPYYHAACLVDGAMIGQSWAEHRKFVLPWTARRTPAK